MKPSISFIIGILILLISGFFIFLIVNNDLSQPEIRLGSTLFSLFILIGISFILQSISIWFDRFFHNYNKSEHEL